MAILGGTAQSTPVLAEELYRARACPVIVRLAARDRFRLSCVARACRLLCPRDDVWFEEYGPGEWKEAVTGADAVVIQLRIGGYNAREFDERLPLRFGVPGDEGLGPGGLSAAFRSWPQVCECLNMVKRNCDASLIILLTSPGSILVRLAACAFPGWDVMHACELPWSTYLDVCNRAGIDYQRASFDYIGVNHLGWLYNLRSGEIDILQKCIGTRRDDCFPSSQLLEALHAYPLKCRGACVRRI